VQRCEMLGPGFLVREAKGPAPIGARAEGMHTLDRLLEIPAEISTLALSADPVWSALRNEPQFQAFIGKTPHKDTSP